MDKIDEQILKELMKNPRVSFQAISDKIAMSPATVQRRFERLKKDEVIFRMTTIIDLTKIGFQGKAFLFISGSTNFDVEHVMQNLAKIPNIFHVSSIVGACDVLAIAVFKKIADVKKTTDKIKSFPGVKKVNVALAAEADYPVKKEFFNVAIDQELL